MVVEFNTHTTEVLYKNFTGSTLSLEKHVEGWDFAFIGWLLLWSRHAITKMTVFAISDSDLFRLSDCRVPSNFSRNFWCWTRIDTYFTQHMSKPWNNGQELLRIRPGVFNQCSLCQVSAKQDHISNHRGRHLLPKNWGLILKFTLPKFQR